MRNIKITGLILGACLLMALPADAAWRSRGRVFVYPAYSWWGWNDPFYYGFYAPFEIYPQYYSNAGKVELKTNRKDADVFINGAYAGKAGKLKSMWLQSDTYSLEVRVPDRKPFTEKIYIVPGKTLKIEADFSSASHS